MILFWGRLKGQIERPIFGKAFAVSCMECQFFEGKNETRQHARLQKLTF